MPLCSLAHPEVGEMNPAAEWRYRLCPPMDVSLFCPSHEESKEKTQNNLWDAGDEDTLEIWPVALKAEIHMKAFKKSCVCVCVYPQWLQKGIGSITLTLRSTACHTEVISLSQHSRQMGLLGSTPVLSSHPASQL